MWWIRPETIYQGKYIWWMKWKPNRHLKHFYICRAYIGLFINIPKVGYIFIDAFGKDKPKDCDTSEA